MTEEEPGNPDRGPASWGWKNPRYKWPRYVLAGVILFLVASVVWVVLEAKKVEHERDFSAPIQTQ